jgi:hypothetical protein
MSDNQNLCSDAASCQEVALERFRDAVALHNAERYLASFYLAGYVIEIGAKAKLFEISKKKFSEFVSNPANAEKVYTNILDALFQKIDGNSASGTVFAPYHAIFDQKHLPDTLENLARFIAKISKLHYQVSNIPKPQEGGQAKKGTCPDLFDFLTRKGDYPIFDVLLHGRVWHKPDKKKVESEEPTLALNSDSIYHNTKLFLETYFRIKLKLEGDTANKIDELVSTYAIDNWDTNVRYAKKLISEDSIDEEPDYPNRKSKEAMCKALRFLIKEFNYTEDRNFKTEFSDLISDCQLDNQDEV